MERSLTPPRTELVQEAQPGCSMGRGVSILWALLDQPTEAAQTRLSRKGLVSDGGGEKSQQSDKEGTKAEI